MKALNAVCAKYNQSKAESFLHMMIPKYFAQIARPPSLLEWLQKKTCPM